MDKLLTHIPAILSLVNRWRFRQIRDALVYWNRLGYACWRRWSPKGLADLLCALGITHAQTSGKACSAERFVTSPDASTAPGRAESPSPGQTSCHVAEHEFSPSLWKGQEHLRAELQVLPGHCQGGAGTAPGSAPSLRAISPHWRSPQEQAMDLLCPCTYAQRLPWQPKQVTLYHFATLWKDCEGMAPESVDSFEGNNLIMHTWNWICPYPWGTSPLMAVAVFPWAS